MILRRFVGALRRQDWLTVTLELLIVVIGIFIGLQADAWNESRKERALERAHLEQLYSDLDYNVQRLTELSEQQAELVEELTFVVSVLMNGSIESGETDRFKWALMTMFRYPPPGLRTGGYDTLVASGDLSVLRDLELKTRLVELHAEVATLRERVEAYTGGYGRDIEIPGAVRAIPHPSGKGVYWSLNYEAVRDFPGSLGIIAIERRNHMMTRDLYADVAGDCADLQAHIGGIIGK
jgi:hypothetical protein